MIPQRTLLFCALAALAAAAPAAAQPQPLGVFGAWGAFRDGARCYAITQPEEAAAAQGWQPSPRSANGPGGAAAASSISASAGRNGRARRCCSGSTAAPSSWSAAAATPGRPTPRADAEIQAAMRTGLDLVVETRSTQGLIVRDLYRLRGAATAIDAAAIACAPRR